MERFIQKIKIELNVSMIIFHVDRKVAKTTCYQLDQNVNSVFVYENRQD